MERWEWKQCEPSVSRRCTRGEVQENGCQEHEHVQWPVRVEVSVQGFHVSVQGVGPEVTST